MKQTEHLQFLVKLIGGNAGWEIIKRDNPAWNLPSDFSLIRVLHRFYSDLTLTQDPQYKRRIYSINPASSSFK